MCVGGEGGGPYFLNDSVAGFVGISQACCCSVKDCALSSSSLPTDSFIYDTPRTVATKDPTTAT